MASELSRMDQPTCAVCEHAPALAKTKGGGFCLTNDAAAFSFT